VDLSGPRTVDGDLDDPQKVAEIVRRFYADVLQDTLLGPMFNDVAHTDWAGPEAEQAKALGRKVADVHCRQIVGEPVRALSTPPERTEA